MQRGGLQAVELALAYDRLLPADQLNVQLAPAGCQDAHLLRVVLGVPGDQGRGDADRLRGQLLELGQPDKAAGAWSALEVLHASHTAIVLASGAIIPLQAHPGALLMLQGAHKAHCGIVALQPRASPEHRLHEG